jgi:hypothetical protein
MMAAIAAKIWPQQAAGEPTMVEEQANRVHELEAQLIALQGELEAIHAKVGPLAELPQDSGAGDAEFYPLFITVNRQANGYDYPERYLVGAFSTPQEAKGMESTLRRMGVENVSAEGHPRIFSTYGCCEVCGCEIRSAPSPQGIEAMGKKAYHKDCIARLATIAGRR